MRVLVADEPFVSFVDLPPVRGLRVYRALLDAGRKRMSRIPAETHKHVSRHGSDNTSERGSTDLSRVVARQGRERLKDGQALFECRKVVAPMTTSSTMTIVSSPLQAVSTRAFP